MKQSQEQEPEAKEEKIDWLELHMKNMKRLQEKANSRSRTDYTEDEFNELKEEVGMCYFNMTCA